MYRKNLSGEMTFNSFLPMPLSDIQIVHTEQLDSLILEVEKVICNWNAYSAELSDKQIQLLMKKEAEYSCKLALGEKPLPFGIIMKARPELEEDTEHLFQATSYALEATEELPLSGRLLKNAHYLMCNSERYRKKYPGEFRNSPVWIGKEGCSLKNALFVPPVYEDMTDAFSELERYINYEKSENVFVRAALIHYQFETIHPFIDANGRTGRLLNTLYLLENGIIQKPVLRWSEILWRCSDRYYAELQQVHETGVFDNWIRFFLDSLKRATANDDLPVINRL